MTVGDAALVGDDLLRAQRDPCRLLGGQRVGLVEAVGVQRLGAAEHRGQRLHRRRARRCCSGCCAVSDTPAVWAWKRSFQLGVLRAEALAHDPRPHAPRGAELGDLLEEVVVHVEEERQPRRELVDVEPGVDAAST
jgi:hypothetical protein